MKREFGRSRREMGMLTLLLLSNLLGALIAGPHLGFRSAFVILAGLVVVLMNRSYLAVYDRADPGPRQRRF